MRMQTHRAGGESGQTAKRAKPAPAPPCASSSSVFAFKRRNHCQIEELTGIGLKSGEPRPLRNTANQTTQVGVFDDSGLSTMSKAVELCYRRALAEGQVEASDEARQRIARIVIAFYNEGTTDPKTLIALAMLALKYGDPSDW